MTTIPDPGTFLARCVLARDDMECSILALAPGEQTTCGEVHAERDHVIFIIEGNITVNLPELTYMMKKEDAMFIASGKEHTIIADTTGWARLLRIDFAPRTVVEPPMFTLPTV